MEYNLNTLYHVTEYKNLEAIMSEGLKPFRANAKIAWPNAKGIYFVTSLSDAYTFARFWMQNKRKVAILKVVTDQRLYYDKQNFGAVYVRRKVAPSCIELVYSGPPRR